MSSYGRTKNTVNANADMYVVPDKHGGRLRACLQCKLIRAQEDWESGCDNCGTSVEIYGDSKVWTTPSFTGMAALMDDTKSWVAKHQRIVRMVPGLYAIAVKGRLSDNTNENEEDEDDDME
eukprot:CAMPEP_0202685842 /NCGR_PEP_ID=MMETSP1385-20130828/1686_1 /ASSEMBLY_ACC=CAM_ASM_000861 /TAXON_ID=933848 /ORGANISM="Elphidium margaritaceum" /LENGTH=120 /DNA_ID=CAMNT_0049340301 /DNA_START=30 /DNA_END=392 /DNA_ORIENTATION=+